VLGADTTVNDSCGFLLSENSDYNLSNQNHAKYKQTPNGSYMDEDFNAQAYRDPSVGYSTPNDWVYVLWAYPLISFLLMAIKDDRLY